MIADMLTGSYAFGAIQTALLGRAQSGRGEYVDVTMMESMMSLIPRQLQDAQLTKTPRDGGFRPIRVNDGYVMICIISEKKYALRGKAMGREELIEDPRFAQRLQRYKNMDAFVAEIESWSANVSAKECEATMNNAGVPCSVYTSTQELFDHPQLIERGAFKQLQDNDGAFKIQNPPFQFAGSDTATQPGHCAGIRRTYCRGIDPTTGLRCRHNSTTVRRRRRASIRINKLTRTSSNQ